jgi:hypothetical protein
MPDKSVDLSNIWAKPKEAATPSFAAPSNTDLSSIWGKKEAAPAPAPTAVSDTSSSPSSLAGIWGGGESRPVSGQPATELGGPTQHLYQDDTQPWYKRAWDWTNTPITESVFGLPESREGAGGFERGVEKIASGLTSPLSLALTAATFGTGGAVESAGATALKQAGGFAADEIPQMAKAAQIALKTFQESQSIEPAINAALEAGGHDLSLLQRAKELTHGLVADTKFGEPAVQNVLEKAGMSEAERTALAAASDTVEKARAEFKPIEDALREAGIDPAKWNQASNILRDNGLNEQDLLGRGILQNGAFQILRKAVPTLPIAVANRAAKTANSLLNAGFTLQQFEMAAQMSPRFLDALKSGDYDHAWEYGTEAVAGGAMGLLGTPHALHAAGELFKPLIENDAFRPNDHWLAIDRANKEREAMHAVAEQHAIDIDQHARQLLGHENARPILGDAPEVKAQKADELAATHLWRDVQQGDKTVAATWHDALAEAAGREDRISPETGQVPPGTVIPPSEVPPRAGTEVLHQNEAGEVRVGTDGRPVVWLSPSSWAHFNNAVEPENPIKGVSYGPDDLGIVGRSLSTASPVHSKDIQELFDTAVTASKQGLLTTAASPRLLHDQAIPVVSEELHHTWQRELSQDGEIHNHLDGAVVQPNGDITVAPGSPWARLHAVIPEEWSKLQDEVGYDPNPVVRVVETAAQFMSHRADNVISISDQAKFLNQYFAEVRAKHGDDAIKNMGDINEIARKHVEDINARTATETAKANRVPEQAKSAGPVQGVGEGRGSSAPPEAEVRKTGLTARELPEDEATQPIGFLSPNVHNLPNVQDAEFRLGSRPQKLAENLSKDFAAALPGVKAVVRPAIGHWEGGAENSTIQRFAPGTDHDAVEYHNAFMAKAGYQNMGAGFLPGAGSDKLFQFRVPSSRANASEIGQVLEAHGIPSDTIEPVPGGYLVHIVSKGDELRAQVGEAASRLDAANIGETNGRAFQHGDYADRPTAERVLDSRINELESKHPSWRPVRQAFESRPDYVGLSKFTRETTNPFISAVHGTRAEGLETVSPSKQFTGPQKGAEAARAKKFPEDYVPKSYWRVEGTHGEPFYERMPYQYKARFNNENLYPFSDDPDGLITKAKAEATARGIQNQPGSIGTIYERMMKENGYDGYYHPTGEIATFKDTPVERQMQEGTSPLTGQVPTLGLAARDLDHTWDDIKPYLTAEEIAKHSTPEKKQALAAAYNMMPTHEEWVAAAQAGRAGQMWYERSSRAFDALMDMGVKWLKPADKDKFLNFTAALSPVQPVRQNLLMAINMWAKWDKAGRPTDVTYKDGVPNKNASLYRIMKGRGASPGVDLPSRLGNAIRALQGEPMSGPKVSAFTKNLGDDANRVTNDTWMAVIGGQDPNRINQPKLYDAMSAHIRKAAEAEGIAPRQAQAAVWSFIKSLAELSGWGNDRWIPPQEIIKQGLLTPELVAKHSSDFADLLSHDQDIRAKIQELGGDLDALDKKLAEYVPGKPVEAGTQATSQQLLGSANRLEAARTNAKIAAHLARKSDAQPGLFGPETDFNPNLMDQAVGFGGGTGINARYMPLYAKENRAPQWYLKSNQIIDSRMQGPMPADTVQKMLENNGVKPDELKYTGLDEFLKSKGKEPVRPEEVRNFLAANNLQIQEVNHGKSPEWNKILAIPFSQRTPEQQSLFERENANVGETKFGSYTLPGGQNYREMLLTLPTEESSAEGKMIGRHWSVIKAVPEDALQPMIQGMANQSGLSPERMLEIAKKARAGGLQQPEEFRSSHWDEPNVVGHVRFNDRVGPNGEKLLHLEELQSDWHQKGRTQGYKEEVSLEKKNAARENTDRARIAANQVLDKLGNLGYDDAFEARQAIIQHPDWAERWDVPDKDDQAVINAYRKAHFDQLDLLKKSNAGAVPDAPFKKTWPELLMKRMVRYAAENGYDGVSWTPGEEQASRYDLSKQLDTIGYQKYQPGGHGEYKYKIEAGKDGQRLITKSGLSEKDLEDTLGKEMAKKIVAGEKTSTTKIRGLMDTDASDEMNVLSGLDLKVGGEGMKGFYDKIVPDLANKLGKQFGAKVGETKIEVPPLLEQKSVYSGPEKTAEELDSLARNWDRGNDVPVAIARQARSVANSVRSGNSFQRAMGLDGSQTLADLLGGKMEKVKAENEAKSIPYFPITDSMRESVLKQGQPLFARNRPENGLPSNIEDMIQNNKFKTLPKEYQDRVLTALKRIATGQMSDRELTAAKYLAQEQDKNWEIGSANDLLHNYIEDYMTRVYKDHNPDGKVILSNAKQGRFATNVNMARQRVYESTLTALLKSPKEMLLDPVQVTAQGRASLIKAAANRQLIDKLRDSFTRASDGRPAVVLSGQGRVVTGQNGEDPKTFIQPDRVRKINVADPVIEQLKKTGEFDKFLEDGTLKDITPYVHPNNIQAAISRLEDQAGKKEAQYDAVGNNKLRTDIMMLKSMLINQDFSGLKAFNDAQPKKYAWDPQDYISLDNGAMKGWNFITNDSAGNGILVRSDIRVHPEFAEYLKNRLGLNPSTISQNPIGKALLGAGTKLKHTLLSLSPFHMVQIGLRGVMTGVNPFTLHAPDLIHGAKIDPTDPSSPTKLYKMVEQGMTTGTDYKSLQEHSEGVSAGGGALRLIPGIGKTVANALDSYQSFLFQRYIPAIKATAAEHMFDEYRRLHPEWSVDRVARVAGSHANDSFGGINWKAMGRNATTQDWGRLLLLAPDWLESEMRSGIRLFNRDEGGLGRAQVIKMAMGLWGIARVLNLLTTGNAHYEAPFGLAVKNKDGKDIIFGMRTLPTDLLHAADDPVGFLKGRLSPTIRMGQEILTQRDNFGRKLSPEDMWVDILHQAMPIPAQSIGQAVTGTGPEVGNTGQIVKALGGTAQTYSSPAQKMAADLASNHTEDGPLDPSMMARHRRIMQFEDDLRTGRMAWPDMVKLAYESDQISEGDLKKIQNNIKKTQGLDPTMASLYTRASRLPAKEYLGLLDTMNPQEKAALATLTLQVQKKYLNKAKKEETPEERAKDPVFQRFLRMIPQTPMQPSTQQ